MNEEKFVLNSHGDGCEWQFNPPAMSQMSRSPYIEASMVEAFSPGYWNHTTSSLNLCLGESSATTVNSIPVGKPVTVSPREMLVSTAPRIFPTSAPHFPVDSSFIERAARFSCFSTGNFTGINFVGPSPAMVSNNEGLGARIQKDELSENKAILLPFDHESFNGSPMKNEVDRKSRIGISNGESHVVNFPEDGLEGNTHSTDVALDSSSSDLGENKRRKITLDVGKDQVQGGLQSLSQTKENIENEQISSKQSGKNGKDNSEVAKEGYVHIRARRGQATNSHSLAERVRREKISERMKCLQELVPGCSKVTGKAVMLDEIINYVQSLQRQVELLHSHGGSSSATGFSPVLMYPQAYPSRHTLVHTGISAMASQSDTFRRAISTQSTTSGYKESSMQVQQMHIPWDEELIMQMAHGANPSNPHDIDSKADGFPI